MAETETSDPGGDALASAEAMLRQGDAPDGSLAGIMGEEAAREHLDAAFERLDDRREAEADAKAWEGRGGEFPAAAEVVSGLEADNPVMLSALREAGGGDAVAAVQSVQSVMRALGPDVVAALDQAGISADDPAILRATVRLGERLARREATTTPTRGTTMATPGGTATAEQMAAEAKRLMRGPAYMNQLHPDHERTHKAVQALFKKAYPGTVEPARAHGGGQGLNIEGAGK